MADEEEVVRALRYPGEVRVTDPRSVETKYVTEDFWGYACDIQQRVLDAFESDNFRIRAGDLTVLCQLSHALWNILAHVDSCACFFERQAVHRSVEESWHCDH